MVRVGLGPRVCAGLVALAGLILSANGPRLTPRPAVREGAYFVVAADLHVHSFPGDGTLPPWEIAVEARRRHLDAIALTNHNSIHSWRLTNWLSLAHRDNGAMLIPGQELTAVGFHLALVGLTTPIDWRQSAASAAAAAHAAGAVAIAAHPDDKTWRFLDDAAIDALDGVEVAHPMILVWEKGRRDLLAFYERARRVHPGIAAIGSTDFHHFKPVGLGRTYLFVTAPTEAGILDALRAGRTVACDGKGVSYGPPDLVASVRDACARDAAASPEGQTARDRTAAWLLWLGLLALVVLGADEVRVT
jgi:predicted metal-dependent phosphoesterase TrpH